MSQQSNPATLREALRALRSTAKDARYDWSEIMAIKIERIADEIEKVAASGTEDAPCTCKSMEGPATCPSHGEPLYRQPDTSDIPEIKDWSKAVVGKFYRPKPSQAAASPEGEGREADLRQHIANLLMVYRTALRFIKTCHEQKAWPKDLPVTEESSNVIERAEAALRQSAAPSGGAVAAQHVDWMQVLLNLMNGQESGRDGQPCFHVDHEGIEERFCLRAKFWAGHDDMHKFVSLADLLAQESKTGAVTDTK